jgi:hypothetical protein
MNTGENPVLRLRIAYFNGLFFPKRSEEVIETKGGEERRPKNEPEKPGNA